MFEKGFEKTQVVCISAISFIGDLTVTGCVTPNPCALLRLQTADSKNHGLEKRKKKLLENQCPRFLELLCHTFWRTVIA